MRLFWLFLGVALLILLPFLIWGDWFEQAFSPAGALAWLESCRGWAWLAGIGLLTADIVLPLPSTPLMSALGIIYGTAGGGLISAAGSFLSGTIAWAACRKFGQRAAARLLGPGEQARAERIFAGAPGAWLVAVSRALPLLPEVIACLAGLTRMPARRFLPALACGCLPVGFLFAWIGASGRESPGLALTLSIAVPAVLYSAGWLWLRRAGKPSDPADPS